MRDVNLVPVLGHQHYMSVCFSLPAFLSPFLPISLLCLAFLPFTLCVSSCILPTHLLYLVSPASLSFIHSVSLSASFPSSLPISLLCLALLSSISLLSFFSSSVSPYLVLFSFLSSSLSPSLLSHYFVHLAFLFSIICLPPFLSHFPFFHPPSPPHPAFT